MENKEFFKMCLIVFGICIGVPIFLALTLIPVFKIIFSSIFMLFSVYVIVQFCILTKNGWI
jgi:hypothetical protein